MSVTISNETYLGSGMPCLDRVSINFDSVSITISKSDYAELVSKMGTKLENDLAQAQKVYDKYRIKMEHMNRFSKDLRALFYDGDEDGDYFFCKDLPDIDRNKLKEVLDNNSKLLGFE